MSETAEFFGATAPTIRSWAEAGCPYIMRGGRGREWMFDSAAVADWRIEVELRRKGVGGTEGKDRTSLAHRKQEAETELREGERDRKMGQLLPVGWLLDIVGIVFDNVNAKLSAIANRCAPLVAVETDVTKCHRIIERAINEARRELVAPEEQNLITAATRDLGVRGAIGKVQADTRAIS